MNPITSWRDRALRLYSPDSPIVLTHPQANFIYPPYAKLADVEEHDPLTSLRAKVTKEPWEKATIHADLTAAFRSWIGELDSSKKWITHTGPVPPELLAALNGFSFHLRELSREPAELLQEFDNIAIQVAGVLISNPHHVDGYFLPFELNFKIFQDLRRRSLDVPILSEESLGLFTFNQVAPGSLRQALQADPKLVLLLSVFPVMSPQGPEVTWMVRNQKATESALAVLPERNDLLRALQAFNTFQSRQDKAVEEFNRRMLAVERGLRTLAVHLQKLTVAGKIRVPLWPEAGFYISIEVLKDGFAAPFHETGGIEEWCLELFEKHGILLIPGNLYGRPNHVGLCYAAMINLLDKAGTRLIEALNPPLR